MSQSKKQAGTIDDDKKKELIEFCSRDVFITSADNKKLQKVSIGLLNEAATYKIPIKCVYLRDCYPTPDNDKSSLEIFGGDDPSLAISRSVREIRIVDLNRTLTEDELKEFLYFALLCKKLKELMFVGYYLPERVRMTSIPFMLDTRNVRVMRSSKCRLNFTNGKWEDSGNDYFRKRDQQRSKKNKDSRESR